MKKKLIFITQALWFGGIETALVNLLRRLDEEKYDITVLILRKERDLASRLPESCRLIVGDREEAVSFQAPYRWARLFHLTEEAADPSLLHRAVMWLVPAIKWVENRLYIRYIRRNLPEETYDTAIIYSDVAAETAVRAVNARKFLMVYHHGAMRRVYHDTIGYRKSEAILTVSKIQEQKLRAFRPEFAEKMQTVHNLTDVLAIREKGNATLDAAFAQDRFHIVTCGRISPEKGMDLAVQACAKLIGKGYPIHWWLVGGGPAEEDVKQEIRRVGMQEHITITGMQANPYPYIRRADLYVQPSRFEGYPMSILEALILGRPIVSTDNGGAGEILRDGVTGILCPICAEGIASAVEALLKDPKKLEALKKTVGALDMDEENRKAVQQLKKLL